MHQVAPPGLAGAKLATQGQPECPRGLGAPGPWQALPYGPNGGLCIQTTLAKGNTGQWQEPQHAGLGALGPTLQLLAAANPDGTPNRAAHCMHKPIIACAHEMVFFTQE